MTLALRSDGPADAPTIVLLHAIATSADLWSPQVSVLAARCRVVRVDLPGHGDSALLDGAATYEDYADAVAATLSAHDIDDYALVGLSFGAMVAMQIAVRHAARLRGLVLACCAAHTPPPMAEMWRGRITAVAADGMAGQTEGTLARWFTPDFAARASLTVEWVRDMILATSPAGFTAAAAMIETLDHRALLPRITTPTLVLAGAHDQAAPPAGLAAIADAIPQARFATIDAAHLANVEAPAAFSEAVGAFARTL